MNNSLEKTEYGIINVHSFVKFVNNLTLFKIYVGKWVILF